MKTTKENEKDPHWSDWRWQIANSLSGVDAARGLSKPSARDAGDGAWKDLAGRYPFRVTPYYLSLADRDNPADPVLRQCVPDLRERDSGATVCPECGCAWKLEGEIA